MLIDLRFRCGVPGDRKINGMYITGLPKIKKEYQKNKNK
jgi:hypothetical protein